MELKLSQSRKVDSPRRGRVIKEEEEEGLEAGGGGGGGGELIQSFPTHFVAHTATAVGSLALFFV
jgi:hypothetical protein